jgi:hypothetical protein
MPRATEQHIHKRVMALRGEAAPAGEDSFWEALDLSAPRASAHHSS